MRMHELVDQPVIERNTPMSTIGEFLQLALGSGFVSLVAVGLLAWAVGVTVRVALGVAGGVILVVLAVFMRRVWQGWFQVETVRPATRPEPAQRRDRVEVEVSEPGEKRMSFLDLPGSAEQLAQLASGVLAGKPFSEGTWSGGARPYTRAEFRQLRGDLLERGLLTWRNDSAPAQGVELTAPGRAVFRKIAQDSTRTRTHARGGGPVTGLLRSQKGGGNGHV